MKFTEEEQALLDRVAPMLDAVDLNTHVPVSYDMDDPRGIRRRYQSERILKLGALCDQMKITPREHNRLVYLTGPEKQAEINEG